MRVEIGRSLIFFLWTEGKYRTEVVRLFQGINGHLLHLVRARKMFGLCFLLVRRTPGAHTPDVSQAQDSRSGTRQSSGA